MAAPPRPARLVVVRRLCSCAAICGIVARVILTPDQRLRIFVSSTLEELAQEREAARRAIESLGLTPVMFELGARPHPPRELYRSYLEQSQLFVGIYWQRYGWTAPDMEISGLHDEYRLGQGMPRLIYVKQPGPDREAGLAALLEEIEHEAGISYKPFGDPSGLEELVRADVALLLSEHFSDDRPASRTARPAASVPVPATPLVGRAREIEELVALLSGPEARLVTLTGPGGVGKTRVAVEVARNLQELDDRDVLFVSLEALRDPAAVLPTIARRLGLQPAGGESPVEAVADVLGRRPTLLTLDNFEQVLDAASDLADLLAACPSLVVLATSRAVLHVRGEQAVPIAPLEAPPEVAGDQPLSQYDAFKLFVDRAKAARPDFEIDERSAPAIAELCHRLDGLPLAIELAAARTRLFSPEELLRRLERDAELLSAGHRDLPERQRTLRGTLAWSYELLTHEEQLLFTRLGVFTGGFALEAVEEVCAGGDLDVVAALSSLIDKSLVRALPATGRAGFGMLRTVRDFATELLEAGEESDEVRTRHANYFLDLACSAQAGLRSSEQALWCGRLDGERPDLMAAFEWAARNQAPERTVAALWALWPFWWIVGPAAEGMAAARAVADRSDLSERDAAYVRAVRGLLGFWLAHYDQALPDVTTALGQLESLGEKEGMAACLGVLGYVQAMLAGDRKGEDLLRQAHELNEQVGDRWSAALTCNALCVVKTYNGTASEEMCQEALARSQELGSPQEVSMALANLARVRVYAGRGADALPYVARSLEHLRPIRHREGAAEVLELLAEAIREEPQRAVALLARAAALRETISAAPHGAGQERVERLREALARDLGADTFGRIWNDAFDPSFERALTAGIDAASVGCR